MNNIKQIVLLVLSMILVGFTLVSCNNEKIKEDIIKEEVSEIKYVDDSYLVDNEWLLKNLNNVEVLILDARGEEAYVKGHIQGSISVAWPQFTNVTGTPGDEGWGVLLDKEELSEQLSNLGITKNKTIIVYSDTKKGWGEDGRIVWMLRMVGVDNSKILDGGWNYWNEKELEISKEVVVSNRSEFVIEEVKENTNITTEELIRNLNELVIIDTREKEEFDGAIKYGEKRGGHIPNAINFTFNNVLNENGTFKTAAELEKLFIEVGLNKEDRIITYCTAGIRSAHLQIALEMMGYIDVKNYDSSYYEWAGNENLNLEEKFMTKNNFNYFTAEQLKKSIENQSPIYIIDIQVEEEFIGGHIDGVIATYAFPVKSKEEKAKLASATELVKNSTKKIIIVCPRGGGGAERTVEYLIENGINTDRIFILENGQSGWPYEDLLSKN